MNIIKDIFVAIGFIGFFLLLGTLGGIDCETMSFKSEVIYSVISLSLMIISFAVVMTIEHFEEKSIAKNKKAACYHSPNLDEYCEYDIFEDVYS